MLDHTLTGEGFISTKEEMQPQPTTLLKLYAMFHSVFSNNNANLQNCRETNVDDIRQGSSGQYLSHDDTF